MSAQQKKLEVLLKWFDENKIEWDKEALEVKEVNGSFGVYAKKNMKKDKAVVKIPKNCILSIKTTGISNILDEANLEGGCPLALAVLYEIAQKEQSPWYGYLQALPDQGEDLPIFWEEDEKDLFNGTEMENAVRNDLNDLEDDYAELIEPLLEDYPYIFDRGTNEDDDPYSFDKFIKISTLISSRAFEVDAFHENALVPFADIFNHKGEGEQVHFETEFEVCDSCGALEYCEHQYLDFLENSDEEHSDEEGHSDEEEHSDEEGGEQGDNVEGEWEDAEDLSEGEEDEMDEEMALDTELPDLEELEAAGVNFWDTEEEEDKKDTCDMVLDRDVKKGEEIFNTYGDHPNIALLSKYGFCYDDNKNDYVSIGEDSIVDCCLAITSEILKGKMPKASNEEVEKAAIELTRPRWEFFLKNEKSLCPSPEGEQEEEEDDFDNGCQEDCCASGDEGHGHGGHGHGHGHGKEGHSHGEDADEEHEHDAEGGCCGSDDDEEHEHDPEGGCCGSDDEGEGGKGRPYFINSEGLFEDKLMCLLHIMFVSEETFAKFAEDIENALSYFEELSNSQGENKTKAIVDVKRVIYQVCRALCEFRRLEYLQDGEWKPIKQDIEERKKVADNLRKYYALTCRIGEKKIIERAIKYYGDLVEEYSAPVADKKKSVANKKKPVAKKNKKQKL
ncbi:hypothetical protein EDC94DRAFT_606415 [Helicostylum pulchrum]|nr:hypothetical protein EDC94DRAFT_606415 [Helicostylum pulchrum]